MNTNISTKIKKLLEKANTCYFISDYSNAQKHAKEALSLSTSISDKLLEINALIRLGAINRVRGNNATARKFLAKALTNSKESKYTQGEADTVRSLGEIERALGNKSKSLALLTEALTLYKKIDYKVGVANSLNSIADIERVLGNNDKARDYLNEALIISKKVDHKRGEADSLRCLGEIDRTMGYKDKARELITQALTTSKSIHYKLGEANSLCSLGDIERLLGNNDKARELLAESLAISKEINHKLGEGNALRSLGEIERVLGNNDKAHDFLSQTIVIYKAINRKLGESNSLNSLGDIERVLGNNDKARDFLTKALNISKKIKHKLGEANAMRSLGDIEREEGEYDKALELFTSALNISRDINHKLGEADSLSSLGDIERVMGDSDKACSLFMNALNIYKDSNSKLGQANALISIAEILEKGGKKERALALEHFNSAFLIGTNIKYGYAINRSQSGIRRISEVNEEKNKVYKSKPPAHIPKNKQVDDIFTEKIKELEQRVISVFGRDSIKDKPDDSKEYLSKLYSMLPQRRLWAITVMCDIRGYTTAMAKTDPEKQLEILNSYLTTCTKIIQDNGGGVDKYMGDSVLGFFLPTDFEQPNKPDKANTVARAISSAIAIANDQQVKKLFSLFSSEYEDLNDSNFGVGVGIASGMAKFGEIGAEWRREYTMIGRPINLVARVQSVADAWQVICTKECWNESVGMPDFPYQATNYFDLENCKPPDILKNVMKGYEATALVEVKNK